MAHQQNYPPAFTWDPTQIASATLTSFFDAENNAKLTDDGGGLCSAWVDTQSAVTLAAATTARPTIQTSATTGRQVLQANGTANTMNITAAPAGWPVSAPFEWWFIGTADGASGSNHTCAAQGPVANKTLAVTRNTADTLSVAAGNGTSTNTATGPVGATAGRVCITAQFDGVNLTAYQNGVVLGGGSGTVACVPSLDTTRFRLFANSATSAGNFWIGGCSAFLVITGNLSTQERNLMYIWARIRLGV